MQGKIIKGIGGFYYIHAEDAGVYECRAKGIFRKDGKKPLVGDNVEISVLDQEKRTGNVDQILPRKNELIRPAVANVDQALVVFAVSAPKPNLNLLDRFLISMRQQQVPVMICFNKADLVGENELKKLADTYAGCGCEVLFASVLERKGLETIAERLTGCTTVVAGRFRCGQIFTDQLSAAGCRDAGGGDQQKD